MHSRSSCRNRCLLAASVAGFIVAAFPAWGQVINEDLKLRPSNGAVRGEFGSSIAMDSGVVAVGARSDDGFRLDSGTAYLFDEATGVQIAKLAPADGSAWDYFGFSIAIDNGVVAVGVPQDNDSVNGLDSGSAYLFDASTGALIAKLLPSDGAPRDQFGCSIAIDNGVIAVGAKWDDDNGRESGSAYVFDASTGALIAKLLPGDGGGGEWFGYSIAIDNGFVAVGAVRGLNHNGTLSGSAYVFDASTGAQIAKLLSNDGAYFDDFGGSIAIDNGVVAVGAHWNDDNGPKSGSVYLFDASTGVQIAKLLPSDGAANEEFGWSIAIDSGFVAVGAYKDDDNGIESGSAYLFDGSTGVQIAKLLPSDGTTDGLFGWSIAIDNGTVAVGAFQDEDNGPSAGSAYLFTVPGAGCPADLTGDDVVNTQDFIAFLNAWANGDPLADWNDDGTVNTQDFIAYLNEWAAGC